jgi:hypothetical protein
VSPSNIGIAPGCVDDAAQVAEAPSESSPRTPDALSGARDGRLMAGDPIPHLMKPSEFRARVLGIGATKFWALQKSGAFDHLRADLAGERLYSGEKVRLWLQGQLNPNPANEHGGRRYLGAARRHHAKKSNETAA